MVTFVIFTFGNKQQRTLRRDDFATAVMVAEEAGRIAQDILKSLQNEQITAEFSFRDLQKAEANIDTMFDALDLIYAPSPPNIESIGTLDYPFKQEKEALMHLALQLKEASEQIVIHPDV